MVRKEISLAQYTTTLTLILHQLFTHNNSVQSWGLTSNIKELMDAQITFYQ